MTDKPTVTVTVSYDFKFSPERVFDAWIDPDRMGKWLFATPTGEVVKVECDPTAGGKFLIVDRRDGEDVDHIGEYTEIDRPKRLAFRFIVPKYTTVYTDIKIDIVPTPDGCRLNLTHEGVWEDYAERTTQGWGMILAALDSALAE